MKALVTGWFSFVDMGATAGDLASRDLVCSWLTEAGWKVDVACAPPFVDGVDWREADPASHDLLIFVCGPFGNGPPLTEFFSHFQGVPFFGVNLSMLQDLAEWNPFDLLLERDSSQAAHPDLVFAATYKPVPVAGKILVDPQPEYKDRGRHAEANQALEALLGSNHLAVVDIDTRLDTNRVGLRTPEEIESLIAKMDVVVTTRLHGMVMALKHGVPAVVVDPIAGGAKILRQAESIGWKQVLLAEDLSAEKLQHALDFCLSEDGRVAAGACRAQALETLDAVKGRFMRGLVDLKQTEL